MKIDTDRIARPGIARQLSRAASMLMVLAASLASRLPAQSPSPPQGEVVAVSTSNPTLSPEELGNLQLARRQYQAALQTFRLVTPKTASVWNRIGVADQQMFMTDDAKRSYEMALKLDPKNSDALNNLGSIYYQLKEYSLAEHMYRRALKVSPKSALIYKNLGTDLLAADKFKKGWDCYQTAMAMDPEIFERVGQLRIGEPTTAQKRGAMNYYLAKTYALAGMQDRAVEYLRMAIDDGFIDRKRVMLDKELAGLHGYTAFERLISEERMQ